MDKYLEVVFNLPAKKSFIYACNGEEPCPLGVRIEALFRNRLLTGYVVKVLSQRPDVDFTIKPIKRVKDKEPLFGPQQLEMAQWISTMYMCSFGEALACMLPGGIRESRVAALEDADLEEVLLKEHALAPQQKHALKTILTAPQGYFYLYGVTGSGKTEVFLQTAKEVLAAGKSVIFLVPEISLTHQVVRILNKRFPQEVAILHSRLTPSQRLVEWMRIKRGQARFILGARSAVFAPTERLGLVIIDEEHENSYKSGATPRYHARQVAMHRCSVSGAKLVMGSATPSVEAYYLMKKKRIQKLYLPLRLSGGKMAENSVVDLKGEQGSLSSLLVQGIKQVKREGRQSILFLNRRGFFYFFHCRSCGFEMTCKHCSVSLTYHKSKHKMICHYCGYTTSPVEVCPACGSLDVGYSGFGTEKIEEDLKQLFPDFRVGRVDTDSVRKKGELERILTEFRQGRLDILLGTQMVAKGLNFPGVKLVGIVQADTGLHLPDFRASERTFALIVQVAGRAGRFLPDGKVIIQSFRPENDAISLAAQGRLEDFYEKEIQIRKELGFPPFSRLFRLIVRGKNRIKVIKTAEQLAERLETGEQKGAFELLGPAECPLSLISGNYRHHILLRSASFPKTHAFLSEKLALFVRPTAVYLEIDVDPVSLL